MCLIIDTCTISEVFNANAGLHQEFKPVLTWLVSGNGKMIYGGTTYRAELRKLTRYLSIIAQLKKAGKIIEAPDDAVDDEEKRIFAVVNKKDFDDPHVLAIVSVTGCRVVCTKDGRAIPYLKNTELYGRGVKRPRIYCGSKNTSLLSDKYAATICKKK